MCKAKRVLAACAELQEQLAPVVYLAPAAHKVFRAYRGRKARQV